MLWIIFSIFWVGFVYSLIHGVKQKKQLSKKNITSSINEDKMTEDNTSKNKPFAKGSVLWVLVLAITVGLFAGSYHFISEQYWLSKIKKENASQTQSTSEHSSQVGPSSTSSNTLTSKEKRKEFASTIKQALNAPGFPLMCEDAYFNDLGELIIEVNGEWIILDDGLKQDIVYSLEKILKENKDELGVEGYGQFFSTSGRGLDIFYAN